MAAVTKECVGLTSRDKRLQRLSGHRPRAPKQPAPPLPASWPPAGPAGPTQKRKVEAPAGRRGRELTSGNAPAGEGVGLPPLAGGNG